MGDLTSMAKARRELEELYLGIPDDSVNLTFQDLAEVREKKKSPPMEPICEAAAKKQETAPLAKLPSLDFNRAIEASIEANRYHQNRFRLHQQNHRVVADHHPDRVIYDNHQDHPAFSIDQDEFHGYPRGHHPHHALGDRHHVSPQSHHVVMGHAVESSVAFDDVSQMTGMSMTSMSGYPERSGRRRPGIPHSNICTVCSTYIYLFRHRCLVCGRVYCRSCVSIGMGEMTEGRKCVECLGKRFSQRYIQKAGQVGCCMGYPSTLKQQELKWAEKGPRRSGENQYGRSAMRSRSPGPRTPTRPHTPNNNTPSFVMSSPYSPYASAHHPMPF